MIEWPGLPEDFEWETSSDEEDDRLFIVSILKKSTNERYSRDSITTAQVIGADDIEVLIQDRVNCCHNGFLNYMKFLIGAELKRVNDEIKLKKARARIAQVLAGNND